MHVPFMNIPTHQQLPSGGRLQRAWRVDHLSPPCLSTSAIIIAHTFPWFNITHAFHSGFASVHEIRAAWTDGRNGLSTTNARKSRWTRLRAGQDQDPQVGGAWSHPRSPPFIATPSPSVSDALPKGAVKPSTRSVPVLRLLVGGSAIETTVSAS